MMTPRCFAAGILALTLAACGGGGGSGPGYPLDRELASAIPADTILLTGGRLDLLQRSPLYAKFQSALPGDGMASLTARFGLDARKDIKEFVGAYNGREPVLLASGTFRTADVLSKLSAEAGAERAEYKGKAMVTNQGGAGVAALSGTMLAAGPAARLRECIDRLAASAKLDEKWAKGLQTLPRDAQLWLLSGGGATLNLPTGTNLGNIDKILASVESVSAWADLSKSVRISALAASRDAATAKQLHTQLRGLIGMGRLSTPDDKPELLKVYDAVQTKLDDKRITLDLDIESATVDILLKQFRP